MVGTQVSAREFFRSAYENRYTWAPGFPGYTTDVTFISGDTTATAKARVNPDLKAEVFEVEDEATQKAIQYQLWEVAIHRIRRSFEDTHGSNSFSYGKTLADGSVEILMGGKAEGDRYELRDNEVSMVHRHIHGTVVTIHTFTSHDTGEGYLSQRYDSVYHDPESGQQKGGRSVFEDNYEKVGDYVILTERKIQTETATGTTEQIFRFSNIALLSN
ncbi:MAG: DUF3386 domain-containing protein [Leptolyngbyaceae cyanobacterium]